MKGKNVLGISAAVSAIVVTVVANKLSVFSFDELTPLFISSIDFVMGQMTVSIWLAILISLVAIFGCALFLFALYVSYRTQEQKQERIYNNFLWRWKDTGSESPYELRCFCTGCDFELLLSEYDQNRGVGALHGLNFESNTLLLRCRGCGAIEDTHCKTRTELEGAVTLLIERDSRNKKNKR